VALQTRMVTFDCADPARLASFWAAATGLRESWRHENDFLILGETPGLCLGFQRVPEAKTVKNRVHLDWSSDGDAVAEIERLLELGATVVDRQKMPQGFGWTVLANPDGNEFCVATPTT